MLHLVTPLFSSFLSFTTLATLPTSTLQYTDDVASVAPGALHLSLWYDVSGKSGTFADGRFIESTTTWNHGAGVLVKVGLGAGLELSAMQEAATGEDGRGITNPRLALKWFPEAAAGIGGFVELRPGLGTLEGGGRERAWTAAAGALVDRDRLLFDTIGVSGRAAVAYVFARQGEAAPQPELDLLLRPRATFDRLSLFCALEWLQRFGGDAGSSADRVLLGWAGVGVALTEGLTVEASVDEPLFGSAITEAQDDTWHGFLTLRGALSL